MLVFSFMSPVNDALDFGVVRPADSLCLERMDVEGQFLERLDEERELFLERSDVDKELFSGYRGRTFLEGVRQRTVF